MGKLPITPPARKCTATEREEAPLCFALPASQRCCTPVAEVLVLTSTRLRRPHHHSIERPVGDVAQVVRSTIFRSAAKKTSFVQGAAAF